MINIVIDTNVIVSSFLNKFGVPSQIVKLVYDKKVQLFLSEEIFYEYKTVLRRTKFNIDEIKINDFLTSILKFSMLLKPNKIEEIKFSDNSDLKFYKLAIFAKAILITRNKHFPNESLVQSPREFINLLMDS